MSYADEMGTSAIAWCRRLCQRIAGSCRLRLAGHQCTHLGGCGRAWVAAHALELALDVGNGNGAAYLGIELVDDGPWQLRGTREPGPRDDFKSRDGFLRDRWHVGKIAPAHLARDGERAEFARADARADRSRRCRDEIDVPLQEAGHGRRLAAIGNVQKLCFGLVADEFDRGV